MNLWTERAAKLALMLWAVATWLTGYGFAPMLFAKWQKIEAGLITGELLRMVYVISLLCALVLLTDARLRYKHQLLHLQDLGWILAGLFMVIIQYAVLTPKMQMLKATMQNTPSDASAFMQLHGISQIIYLLTSVVLAVLVWRRILK